MEEEPIPIAEIYVPAKRKHEIDAARVESIAESILEEGLHVPITVRRDEARGRFVLVEGLQRLEAMRALGEDEIPGLIVRARQH